MIDEVQKEKKLCLEKAKKMLFDDVSKWIIKVFDYGCEHRSSLTLGRILHTK